MLEILCDAGVLTRIGKESYAFLNLAFQEYLTAEALAARGWVAIAERIDRLSWSPVWEEVIIHLAGLLADPAPLLELLADPHKDDSLRHRTRLAGRCLDALGTNARKRLGPLAADIAARAAAAAGFHPRDTERPTMARLNEWAEQLAGGEVTARIRVALEIASLGATAAMPMIMAAIAQALRDAHAGVRSAAALAVASWGLAAATPEIINLLWEMLAAEEVVEVRIAALNALAAMGPAAAIPTLLPSLAATLADNDGAVRNAAIYAVTALGPASPEFLASLAALLEGDAPGRSAAAEAVAGLGALEKPEILAALAAMLRHADRDARRDAIGLVGRLGGASSTPEIIAALTDLLSSL
jgi:hypothetical protein